MKFLIGIILLLTLTSCELSWSDEWKGFLYPDKGNLSSFIIVGKFEDLDQCRNAIKAHPRFSYLSSDYECGLNCKPSSSGYVDICKKTLR